MDTIRKVLYVEDDASIRDVFTEYLQRRFVTVITAIDGEDGLSSCEVYTISWGDVSVDSDVGAVTISMSIPALSSHVRYTADVMKSYVDLLLETEQEEKAEEALRDGMKNVWHDELIEIFGRLKGKDASKQLLFAEQQLKERPNDPLLLLTLGRLALRVNNLEKAREYLQTGLSIKGLPELHAEMGKVMLAEGDETLACEHFQLALGH